MKMMNILKKVDGLPIAPVSDGTDIQNKILSDELDFKIHKFKSNLEYNGWIVPKKWGVKKAQILKNGKIVYDGLTHPLGVIGYSESFVGKVTLKELKKHLYFSKESPKDIVYHCDQYYKPHRKLWGFSVPYNLFKKLKTGDYFVDLKTIHVTDSMKVLEYDHFGHSKKTIVLNAHNCHAAQLNDGPSGYVVGIEVLKRLRSQKTRYSYKLLIAPEHFGTVFYLHHFTPKKLKALKYCIFLEMLGNDWPHFALQETFMGNSDLDMAAHHLLKNWFSNYRWDKYRKVVGNDENVWEAPGIEIPTISLSRCRKSDYYYPQYHLSSDNISIMNEKRLDESVEMVLGIIDIMEKNCRIKRKFTGLIALSNPKYNLYFSYPDPSSKEKISKNQLKWNHLMNCVTRYFDESLTVLEIAEKFELPFDQVYSYLLKFKDKKLIDFVYD